MNKKITVIGLGYVGLPLARLFATKYAVVGFDLKQDRINELKSGKDRTQEVDSELLINVLVSENPKKEEIGLFLSNNITDIQDSDIYIVTVPTPVDKNNRPDLSALYKASETVGSVIAQNDIVIYESTVYPGATEEDCIPIIEKQSGLIFNKDFFAGYSPERINPGDKEHSVEKILKVTSGSNPEIAQLIDELYRSVITAGTYLAPSIKVAEAAKVIENSQRDVNIAFVNELAKILNLMRIDTNEVLKAASTKWNFLNFKPGLVGGHCTGVDPYYLAQKAQQYGYHPEIILAGRRMNDSMGHYIASETVKRMLKNDLKIKGSEVLVLGFTFKENCPDVRNTKVIDVVRSLEDYSIDVNVFDPWLDPKEVKETYGLDVVSKAPFKKFEAVILAVPHKEFEQINIKNLLTENGIIYDVKGILEKEDNIKRL
ncbi:nucleotide sugar dehydrogenase [Epilithonimonas hungarica]|uniref:UDP-N-acetyl-D-galactosamine dehydrogenase n=1 Tax=Epilithonimonas hungarica TaxID=454006 RepID=A0A1G7FLS7_9FLAO|nr:nucleotide sugar dehydrogenase [Epilithonimonas hungarica]SDE76615.1 UDP-N-acetyl-D-galactosamine dehydrogenase [Epilithonimonas hungarica]